MACRHTRPDNGQKFGGAFRRQLARLGVMLINSAPNRPRSNGAVERFVCMIKQTLAAKAAAVSALWLQVLPQVQGNYMARVHSTTGFFPNDFIHAHRINRPPPIGNLLTTTAAALTAEGA